MPQVFEQSLFLFLLNFWAFAALLKWKWRSSKSSRVSSLSVAPGPPYIFSLSFSLEREREWRKMHTWNWISHMCVRNSQVGSSCYSVLVSTNDFFCALEKYIGEFPAPLRPPLITVNFASLHFFFFLLLSCREMIILGEAASIDGKICISCIAIFYHWS